MRVDRSLRLDERSDERSDEFGKSDTFGKIDFNVSQIGFGGYRIYEKSKEHGDALEYALVNGFNLIDTSSNYTGGGSERLIGNILKQMIQDGEINREDFLLISKGGYVQGENLTLAREHETQGHPFPEMVKYMEGCWHCINPDFLENQLQRTLNNLQTDNLDVYLLHNPEYFLTHIKNRRLMDLGAARKEYERRIGQAFCWLEEKIKTGKIKAYGISSNTFINPADDFEFTSLERVLEIAEAITSNHNFNVIQFPLNLFEPGACLEKNQACGTKTLLDFALEKNIATLINRPLNAIVGNRMIRLADFDDIHHQTIMENFSRLEKKSMELGSRFKTDFKIKWPEGSDLTHIDRLFSIPQYLSSALIKIQSWEQWDYEKEYRIMPQIYDAVNYLENIMPVDAEWQDWVVEFSQSLFQLLEIAATHFKTSKHAFAATFCQRLDELDPDLKTSASLSSKALRILRSIPGVDSILLGMRKRDYVDDALETLKGPPIRNAVSILSSISQEELIRQWEK